MGNLSSSPSSAIGVAVVGGGVAGLAAASYLGRAGLAVTLVEKADNLGGRAATDCHQGYALNRGIHALYSGGPASEVLHELGVRYTSGVPKNVCALDARGLHRFPITPGDFVRTSLLNAREKRELAIVFVGLSLARPAAHHQQSIADWIFQATRSVRLRKLLRALASIYAYSAALDLISADIFIARLQQTMKHPIHYVDGGWQTLVNGLHDAANSAGVRVVASTRAERIELTQDGRAAGVRLQSGDVLQAAAVVLALPPNDALHVLGSQAGAHLQRSIERSVPAYAACLDLALSSLPSPECLAVFDLDRPLFVAVQSEVARLGPAGGAVIHAVKQLDPREALDPRQDRADLEALLDACQPGWRPIVVEQRFLPRMLASSTLPLVAQAGLSGRAACASADVPGLYFAGDWVGSAGFLVDASLASARQAARLIVGKHFGQLSQRGAQDAAVPRLAA